MNIRKFIRAVVCLGLSFCLVVSNAPLGASGLPSADFSAAAKPGNPLDIAFTDKSTGDIAKWKWDFGDESLPFIVSYQTKSEDTLVSTIIETASPTASGNIIVCATHEALMGPNGEDINHNGMFDPILLYLDISSNTLVNTMALPFNQIHNIFGDMVTFVTQERAAQTDLNGDGRLGSYIVMYYDVRENKLVSTGAETTWDRDPSVSGNIIAFVTSETSINKDLDGNGSINDWVVRYFDKTSGRIFNTKGIIFSIGSPGVFGNIIAFPTYESEYKGDLNGDGDKTDMVLRYFNVTNNELINTAAEMSGGVFTIFGGKIAFISRERSVGITGMDLNGDGDIDDFVVRYFDVSTGRIINTGAEAKSGTSLSMSADIIAFITPEAFVGPVGNDLNGDGDTFDDILRYYELSTGRTINTHAEIYTNVFAVSNPSVDGRRIAFLTDESSVGRSGADLNGDGDIGGLLPDIIVRYFDASTGMLSNTGAEAVGSGLSISGNVIAFTTSEKTIGANGLDLNGNGNLEERMLRYFVIGGQTFNGNTSHIYEKPGAYTVTLTIIDKNGVTSSVTKNITVGQVVLPPFATFTASPSPAQGDAPLLVQFTDASTNNPTSWFWDFGDGSSIDNTQNPVHTYNTSGTYSVSLTVSNQAGTNTKTIPHLITVTAPDTTAPVVSISAPLDNALVKDAIFIKATATDDKGVNRVEFYIDNTLHSADNTSPYEYSWDTQTVRDGDHNLKAKAYDEAGNNGEDVITVRVGNVIPNRPPVLDPIGNQTIDEGQELRFTVSAFDPDGDTLSYSAGNLPSGATFLAQTFSWITNHNQSGNYSVTFNVTDNKSPLVSETIIITVNDVVIPSSNHPPVANAGPEQTTESAQPLQLDGSASLDSDNDPLSYQWTQLSGIPVSLQNANQAIANLIAPEVTREENMEFQLTVRDPGSLSAADTTTIIVRPRPITQPTIQITNPPHNSLIAPRSQISISANLKDPDNLIKKVSFLINNKTYRAGKNRQGTYYYNWTVPYGYSRTYTIQAQVQDKQGNLIDQGQITLFTSPAPSISIISPQDNQIIRPKEKITIQAQYSPNNNGITKTEFIIINQTTNKQVRKQTDSSSPYQFNWTVPRNALPNTTYLIQAKGYSQDTTNREILIGQDEAIVRGE